MSIQASVPAAELVRQFGRWQDHAATQPVMITHHGRGRVVLISADHYDQITNGPSEGHGSTTSSSFAETEVLLDHVAEGFFAFAADMRISAINRAACCFLQMDREALLGHRLEERLPGIDDTPGYVNLIKAAKSGSMKTLEIPSFAYADRWLRVRTFPYRDGAACLFCDVTDEVDARQQAGIRTATLAALTVHGGVGRAKLSTRGTFVEVDEPFASLSGFPLPGLVKARLTDILGTRSRARVADTIEGVLEKGQAHSVDAQLLTRSGEEQDVRIGLAPVRLHGAISGAVVIMTRM